MILIFKEEPKDDSEKKQEQVRELLEMMGHKPYM